MNELDEQKPASQLGIRNRPTDGERLGPTPQAVGAPAKPLNLSGDMPAPALEFGGLGVGARGPATTAPVGFGMRKAMGPTSETESPSRPPAVGAFGFGDARRAAGDYDRTTRAAPPPPPSSSPSAVPLIPAGFTQVGADIYRKGNMFTDATGMSDTGFQSRGAVSPQNMAAAEGLAKRYAGNPQYDAEVATANAINARVPVESSGGFGLLDANRIAARNASIGSSSTEKQPGESRSDYATRIGAMTAQRGQEVDERGNIRSNETSMRNTDVTSSTSRANTLTGEAGANVRAGMTADIQRGELVTKQIAAGFNARTAADLERARTAYLSAKTPEAQAAAAKQLQVLNGKADVPTAPSGYRWGSDGNLQAIPGGPGDKTLQGKPMPSSAANGLLTNRENLRRAESALALLNGQTLPGGATGDPQATGLKGYLPNQVSNRVDPQGVDTRAAIADLGSLVIHDRSGAAVTAAEFPRLAPFIPTEKDDPATARKKLEQFGKNYRATIDDTTEFYRSMGYNVPDDRHPGQQGNQGSQRQQPADTGQSQAPQAGEIRRGYRFKGGNPSDRNSWEAVQ